MSPTVSTNPARFAIWHGPSLFIAGPYGTAEPEDSLAGFYFREARFLRTLRLEINGERPWTCAIGAPSANELLIGLVYPEMRGGGGGGSGQAGEEADTNEHGIARRAVDLMLRVRLGFDRLHAELTATNRDSAPVSLDIAWCVDADFADLREAYAGERTQQADVAREFTVSAGGAQAAFGYQMDALPFRTQVDVSGPGEWSAERGRLATQLTLRSQDEARIELRATAVDCEGVLSLEEIDERERHQAEWRRRLARAQSPGGSAFAQMVNRAMDDLGSFALLEGDRDTWLAPMAGVPLYPALFGRDSLTTAWQAAVLDRGEQLDAVLTRLTQLQGTTVDGERDEQPGRIIHSHRRGPLSRLGHDPFGRYYGDFASPLMFVISLAQLYSWTGERRVLDRHWDAARRALDWARDYGDIDGDGYLEYCTQAEAGPKNQGWKDSGDAVVDEQGRQVPAPLATCELQGYWYGAQQLFAVLCAVRGEVGEARAWWSEAKALKERFNRDWWAPAEGCVGFAMGADKRLVTSPTSNAAQCITTGIISDEHLPAAVERLFRPDMYSGWGIRTLSSSHPSYNPISYHLGSVWSVENATVGFGLRRFGFDDEALKLATGLMELAGMFDRGRIPECVGGHARDEWAHPSAYPQANSVQAWNQSALPLLLQTLLGLQPVAALGMLVIDPALPWWLPEVVLKDLRLGGATATLRFWRDAGGRSHGEVVRKRGTLRMVRQPPPESLTAGPLDRFRGLLEGVR